MIKIVFLVMSIVILSYFAPLAYADTTFFDNENEAFVMGSIVSVPQPVPALLADGPSELSKNKTKEGEEKNITDVQSRIISTIEQSYFVIAFLVLVLGLLIVSEFFRRKLRTPKATKKRKH